MNSLTCCDFKIIHIFIKFNHIYYKKLGRFILITLKLSVNILTNLKTNKIVIRKLQNILVKQQNYRIISVFIKLARMYV